MLKACSKCGKVHESGFICAAVKQRRDSRSDKFRNTALWRRKAGQIKKRDCCLCRVCFENLYNTVRRFNSEKVSVHHIIPISEDYGRRLDSDNLITLCPYHHELAEKGSIPREFLRGLAAGSPDFSAIK